MVDVNLAKNIWDNTYQIELSQQDWNNLLNYAINLMVAFTKYEQKTIELSLKPLERVVLGDKIIVYEVQVLNGSIENRNRDIIAISNANIRILANQTNSVWFTTKFVYFMYYLYMNVKDKLQGIRQISRNVGGVSENTQYDIDIIKKIQDIFIEKEGFGLDCFVVVYRNDGIEYV